jgi:hypothetical protein
MPRYVVEGADRATGENRALSVDAPDQEEARSEAQRQGVMVSYVRLTEEEDDLTAMASAMSSKLYRVTQPAPTVGYRAPDPTRGDSREYFGLVIAGWTLRVLGGLEILLTLLSLILNAAASIHGSGVSFMLSLVEGSVSSLAWGAIFLGLSEVAFILRKYAMNHFQGK